MDTLFENLKKSLSVAKDEAEKITKNVIHKTANIVDITKLNLAKNDIDNKIDKLYSKIGKIIYDAYLEGTEYNEEISGLCVELDKFKAESNELKEQIAQCKNTISCAECGQYNDAANEYCTKCGAKMTSDADETVVPDAVIDVTPEDID